MRTVTLPLDTQGSGEVNMQKGESESTSNSVALVVIELPADELLGGEPAIEAIQTKPPRRAKRLLAQSRHLARRLNPARPVRIALGGSGRAAKFVVVKLHPRRLARAVRAFRRIGSPRKARRVRVVTTTIRRLVRDIDPSVATRVAREIAQLARTTIAKLDPRLVEDAVRRFVATIDKPGRGTRFDRMARAAVNKIGPERAVRMAAEVTRALKRLVDRLDPDKVGEVISELVAAAKSANDKKGRLRVVGFLASLVAEVGQALKRVAQDVEWRDVVVVAQVVLTTAPKLLIAAGVSANAVRWLTSLLTVLVRVLPERGSGPPSGNVPGSPRSST